MTRSLLFAAALCLSSLAHARSDDEIEEEDDDITFGEETAPTPPRPTEDDDLTVEEDETELETFTDPQGGDDLLGADPNAQLQLGGDTEAIFRKEWERLGALRPDEELLGWEQYLGKYPATVFRARIQGRMEELEAALYADGTRRPTGQAAVDAKDRQLDFAHALQLDQLNPRSRIQAGFEWGLPDYMNLFADYEKAFGKKFSAHAGIRRRYSGFSLELGPRIALVKSPRTMTIVSFWPDIRINTNPAFPSLHPTLGAGKRFGKLDAQAQAGVGLEVRSEATADGAGKTPQLRTRYSGGVSLFYAATDTVGFFGETYLNLRPVAADGAFEGGTFNFHVATFGMKVFPKVPNRPGERPIEVNAGATVPYAQKYWQYHYGSIMGQFNYYPED